jgi:multisubunit Na+/H+ antiporter MnhE subunit
MLYTIAMILLVMWVLGLITSYTMGGFVHILIVAAVVIVLVRVVQGRRLA